MFASETDMWLEVNLGLDKREVGDIVTNKGDIIKSLISQWQTDGS